VLEGTLNTAHSLTRYSLSHSVAFWCVRAFVVAACQTASDCSC